MAVGATDASAAKTDLRLKTAAGPLASGQALLLSSTQVLWHTPAFRVECVKGELTGKLAGNSASKDTASFASDLFEGAEIEGACKSNNMGPTVVSLDTVPWKLEMLKAGTFKLKGTGKLDAHFTFIGRPGSPACLYEAKDIAGVLPTTGPLAVTWTEELFVRSKKKGTNAPSCPSEATVSATWQASSNEEPVEVELVESK
jgi:hypothetical protein